MPVSSRRLSIILHRCEGRLRHLENITTVMVATYIKGIMASPKTLDIQKKKHVESKREWLWVSVKTDPETGKKITKGLTYRKFHPKQKEA